MANIFGIDRPTNKITLGTDATSIVVTPLTASKPLALNASKELESVVIGTSLSYVRPTLNTIQDIRTTASPTLANLTLTSTTSPTLLIQSTDASDPTFTFKTTNTAHQMNVYLDESAWNDTIVFAGQTASRGANIYIQALDGYNAVLTLLSGENISYLYKDSIDDTYLSNETQDTDLIFQINDGGVTKSITWDADVDKLKHSAGLFDFDNDNLNTSGVYQVSGNQVMGARVIDIRCDDAINSGDATTDGVIDALRDAMITHGLIAAA